MTARPRPAALVAAPAGLAATALAALLLACEAPPPAPPPPPPPPTAAEVTPALVAEGAAVFSRKCDHCHRDVPLEKRVRGWDVGRAHAAVGRLEQLTPLMPPFRGSEAERRALAAYLAAVGEGRAPR